MGTDLVDSSMWKYVAKYSEKAPTMYGFVLIESAYLCRLGHSTGLHQRNIVKTMYIDVKIVKHHIKHSHPSQ